MIRMKWPREEYNQGKDGERSEWSSSVRLEASLTLPCPSFLVGMVTAEHQHRGFLKFCSLQVPSLQASPGPLFSNV